MQDINEDWLEKSKEPGRWAFYRIVDSKPAQQRKNFIARNEGFQCEACHKQVLPAPRTFRNHCPSCLTSKHVDNIPGDRTNSCHGLMPTIRIEGTDPDKLDVVQQCELCGKEMRNRTAPDDNQSAIQRTGALLLPPLSKSQPLTP